jgi:hypothetical protein
MIEIIMAMIKTKFGFLQADHQWLGLWRVESLDESGVLLTTRNSPSRALNTHSHNLRISYEILQ